MKSLSTPGFSSVCLLLLLLFCLSCKEDTIKKVNPPEFKEAHRKFISAFTAGLISRTAPVRIRFADFVIPQTEVGKEADNSWFDFQPTLSGKAKWVDRRTIEFKPDKFLYNGMVYNGVFDLGEVYDTISSDLRKFPFQFQTPKQIVDLQIGTLIPVTDDKSAWYKLGGTIKTSEYEYGDKLEQILKIMKDGKALKVRWTHDSLGLSHQFHLDSLERLSKSYSLVISWDAYEMDLDYKGEHSITIPSLGDFKVIDAKSYNAPEQYLSLQFSDALMQSQDLNGLIHSNKCSFSFIVENNTIRAYPSQKLAGPVNVYIEKGIVNAFNYKSKNSDTISLNFEDVPPQLRLIGNGVIVPNSENIPFTFEAINLNAVDVRILKVYEDNVLEFLQFNEMDGNNYLYYVGKVLLEKKVMLNENPSMNLSKWNRHALDLSKLVSAEPGAIYNVEIRFRKDYSLYACVETEEKKEEADSYLMRSEKESLWDYYQYYTYRYDEANSPCKDYYYQSNEGVERNILASDLGMIAKGGTDGSILFAVTDLKSTQPLSKIPIELYDLQKQKLATISTDENGFAHFKSDEMPAVAVASKGSQKGYLKLNSGLSMSKFEVGGNTYHKGIKGFIYTERGVWRPGDSIYVSFILEDKMRALPIDHPVIFELYNPRGQLVNKMVKKDGLNGFYTFKTFTDLNAPTGAYTVKINVGGVVFDKNIRVETIIPNRLKLNLEFEKKKILSSDKNIGSFHVRWLHGAPAGKLETDINVLFRKATTAFPAYKGYVFEDPLMSYDTESKAVFKGQVDEDGKVTLSNNLKITQGVPGALSANFFCKVFEPGGNFSTDNFSTTYYPYKEYAGIKVPEGDGDVGVLFTGKTHSIDVVAVDEEGKPVEKEVTMQLYKLEWRWWWDYYDDLSSYNGRFYNDPVKEEKIKLVGGKGKWSINIEEERWGRYMIRATIKDGHSTGKIVYIDHPGWYSRRPESFEGTTMLNFSSDKDKYVAGEKATLEVPTGFKGKALVTIEKGGKVIKADWIEANKGKTFYSFTITPEMAPNIFAYVTLLQPHAQTSNDLPMRLYGVIPINVDNPSSHLAPVISMPDVIRPEEKVNISVKEKNGRKMTYTLAIVDDGLLDLTKFRTPDAWPHFYAKEALEVRTWDLYDLVLGNQSKGVKKLLSIGGDGDGREAGQGSKVQRFKPMVKFLGPFYLEPGQTINHSVMMPKYVGSVRTMVIAGLDGAYGSAEKTSAVRKPLMLLGTLPRVLGPNEEVTLPVSVFVEEHIKTVTVELKTNGLLSVQGPAKQTITFTKAGEQLVNFPVKVNAELGVAKAWIIGSSGKERASFDIELEVRAPNPYIVKNTDQVLEKGETKIIPYEAFGLKGTNKGTLEISSMPSINLEKRLDYLIQYPHGCLEQTTSSVFPQVALAELIYLSPERKREVDNNIKAGIRKLRTFQQSGGGMSYWPGDYDGADEWATNYAGNFLIEANNRGHYVPAEMLDSWKEFQRKKANLWMPSDYYNSDLIQAYRLYLLSLLRAPEFGAMNRMKEKKKLSTAAKWYLAGAYHLAGQKTIASTLIKDLPTEIKDYRELSYTYGSSLRDQAIILEMLSLMNRKSEAAKVMSHIARELRSEQWMNTQETAYCLLAISKFGSNVGYTMQVQYRINDKEWKTVSGTNPLYQVAMDVSKDTKGKVEIRNLSQGMIYTNLVMKGIPAAGNEAAFSNEVKLEVVYKNIKGEKINVDELEQGTDIIAEIIVKNEGTYESLNEMALTFIFPSGWQVHNPRMTGDQYALKTSQPEYMDVRDDRIHYYFDIYNYNYYNRYYYNRYNDDEDAGYEYDEKEGYQKVFRIALNVSYLGKFYLPAAYTEAMYDKGISAGTVGKWIKVVPRKTKAF